MINISVDLMDINDEALHTILESTVKINSITRNANSNFTFQLEGAKKGLLRVLDILLEEDEEFLRQLQQNYKPVGDELYRLERLGEDLYQVTGNLSKVVWKLGSYAECHEWINS
jgi:hypothetical protein